MKIGAVDFKNLDKKSKIEIIITSVLIVIFMIIVINAVNSMFSKGGKPSSVAISPNLLEEITHQDLAQKAESAISKKGDFIKDRFPSWGRDPFQKIDASKAMLGLQGIMWDTQNPKAIINNKIVKVGDTVGGDIIVDIQEDKVILTDGIESYELRLLLK